ncbi:MAG: fused MFS/spermidine synthase [Verrucomicrobia bacterium]|nr:fused MFS/spermidine synthase [Verrucomicrobiota bacterium]
MVNFAFYLVVVTLGVLSMGFQLLGSRLLSPHFGSSIIVWSWLISTFLAAFSSGSMLGGWISNLSEERRGRGRWIAAAVAVASLAFTAFGGRATLNQIELGMSSEGVGLFTACVSLFFVPVTALSCFGPQCVQFLATRGTPPGKASGLVYGVSTLGNIAGVMLTAFVLIPNFRVSTLLSVWLGVAAAGLLALIGLLRLPSNS